MTTSKSIFLTLVIAFLGCAEGDGDGDTSDPPVQMDAVVADGQMSLSDVGRDAGPFPMGDLGTDADLGGRSYPAFEPAAPTMYRLTRTQYRNALVDVFGAQTRLPDALETDTPIHGFTSIGASELSISPVAVEQYETAAFAVSEQVFTDAERRAAFFPCRAPADDDQCLRAGLSALGRQLWRRPLAESEVQTHVDLVTTLGPRLRDPWLSISFAVAALLQSPHFLFRIERGEPDPENPPLRRYTDYEMAGRLAFLFWNRGPDDALLDAAEEGLLTTVEGLRTTVERLVSDERARASTLRFFGEFLNLERLDTLQKERALFPLMSDTLGASMRQEIEAMIESVVLNDEADIHSLLTTRRTVVNTELAALYQLPGVMDWTPVEFTERWPRAGLLTTAGFLAMNAHNTVTSPTHRGKYIQNKILCFDVPPPPPGVVTSLEAVVVDEPVTTRQKLERHRSDPSCAGCHVFMDPLGLALENFDALGMWRTTQNGLPIDASGSLDRVPFVGAKSLGQMLAARPDFGACVVRQLYRHGMGHLENEEEEIAIHTLQTSFRRSEHRFLDLLVDLAMSEAFRRPGAIQ